MSITAKELAAKLGISAAAVSMALNHKPGVSTATRQKVWDAARAYGYDFSKKLYAGAPALGTICLAIYKKNGAVVGDTPFFSALSDGVGAGCKQRNYALVIRYLYEDDGLPGQIYDMEQAGYAGIILLATEMTESSFAPFARLKTPVLVLDAYFETLGYSYVLINNIQGAYLATGYLISKFRTQPGYLRSAYAISNFSERADGFYKALRANGMSTSKSPVHLLTPSQEGAMADMRALLAGGEEPARCYFADNDHIAVGAISALKEAGYRIPEDVAVIGFDDLPLCEFLDPPLTTVHVPAQFMGETAADRIVRIIDGDSLPTKTEIGTTLKKRKSG